jgi:hypothetical protein
MKTIKTMSILILFLFISSDLCAKEVVFKGDTIRYRFDNMLVEITSTDFIAESPEKNGWEEQITLVQKILAEMSVAIPAEDERVFILIRDMGDNLMEWNYKDLELKREKKNAKNLIVFEDGTIFEKEFGRYCVCFMYRTVDMKIYINDLADLSFFTSETFMQKTGEGTESVSNTIGQNYRKSPVRACVDLRASEPKVYIQSPAYKTLDVLEITGGVGSGWVKNTFVSDINFRLGLGFARRGMIRNIYSAGWDMMYDFSESNDNRFYQLNHFVSLGWEHNFSNSPMEDKWYGFSVGYLVKRNGDFFKENTFRVSVKKKINDTISLKPELYFNDAFRNIYPGIRVSVAF